MLLRYWPLLLVGLASCAPSGQEVAGRYVAPYAGGTDYVELHADKTYVHFGTVAGVRRHQTGTWQFETRLGQQKFVLHNWTYYVDPYAGIRAEPWTPGITTSVYWSKDEISFYEEYEKYNYYRSP
ncbi:MAG: hypothetical protein EOO60_09835 [Hymenobacter sp.]|nr:MAG: hypothetical protein EOO60_09835 [Hymenobacter sp.]